MSVKDFLPKYCYSDSNNIIHDLPRDFAYALFKAGVQNVQITNFPVCGKWDSIKYASFHSASFSCDYVSIDKSGKPFSWQLLDYLNISYSGSSDNKTYAQSCLHWYCFENDKNKRFPPPYHGPYGGTLESYKESFVFRMICAFNYIKKANFKD